MFAERPAPTVRYRVADPTPYGKIVYGRRDVPDHVTRDWLPIPYIDQGEGGAYLKSLRVKGSNDGSTGESLSYPLLDRPFAYHLIDAGADVILGHHPPHRKGIEVDRGKVIINASSNLLRGHNGPRLDGRHLARSTLGPNSVDNVEVLPIIGKGQPERHTWTRVNESASSAQFRPLTRPWRKNCK